MCFGRMYINIKEKEDNNTLITGGDYEAQTNQQARGWQAAICILGK